MHELITTDLNKCAGCNRCVRACPVQEANIAALDGDGQVKVTIDSNKCLGCGACIEVCQHEARAYADDTERFFQDLERGEQISLIVAPAIRTNFTNWPSLLSWLRSKGVKLILDVSLGADICTWAHIRYVQKNHPKTVITQPCPAIVDYIEKYQPRLLSALSPVHSPMLCTVVYMRRYMGVTGKIGAISPCIAKKKEFDATGDVAYNITFRKLSEYIEQRGIHIPTTNSFRFDHEESALGKLYPMPGGLKENLEYYIGKSLRVDKSEGQSVVYHHIDEFAGERQDNLPAIFDVLNCAEGCNSGTGCRHKSTVFEIASVMDKARQKAMVDHSKPPMEENTQMFDRFDEQLRLNDFIRRYTPHTVMPISVTHDSIERAMVTLGKTTEAQRTHNCYACGCETCHEMAERIAKGINIPENCIEKTRMDILHEHEAFLQEQQSSNENLSRISAEIDDIRSRFAGVLSGVQNVSNVIDQYNNMAKVINDIALQTQLLSLNASVEAARAGSVGKGFAVVAGAIRDLSSKSQDSVNSVSETGTFARATIDEISDASQSVNTSITNVVSYLDEISAASQRSKKDASTGMTISH